VKRGALILLTLAGLSFPLGLALAVYLTAGQSLASVPAANSIGSVGKPSTEPRATSDRSDTTKRTRKKNAPSSTSGGPSTTSSSDDDSSGHGSDGSDDSSGKGSGKDDSSGHGSDSDD
jgi:hypothetical protein